MHYRKRLNRLLSRLQAREISVSEVTASVQGWVDHARYGNTVGLRKALLGSLDFIPG